MTRRQWRITVNDAQSIREEYPGNAEWSRIAAVADERGLHAKLESREIFPDSSIKSMLTDLTGWISLPDGQMISPWNVIAEVSE